ncbi:MAG: glycosyltransferase [Pedobacter sp.]|nr:MAG: glycosyltransferase [Pedobacter sp.]
MGKNIITSWIDLQNELLCLKINSMYYKKVEAGRSIYYVFHPKFYPFLLLRLFVVFLNFFRFNSLLYQPYKIRSQKTFFSNQIKSSFLKNSFEFFFIFAGLRHFVKPSYEADYYNQRIKDVDLSFSKTDKPIVSIIIPVFNQVEYTRTCLKSIALNVSKKYEFEVIVIDDCSTDQTSEIIASLHGIVYKRNSENMGFLLSCVRGIEVSKGKYICLLNNDTIVLNNWLESLVETIEDDPNVGCVGSKLIYPYGLLQEAGGIIYSDGSGVNYGKYQNINYSKYNYKRNVDYCSGASLLFKKEDYTTIGGLDKRFEPAYYEDTDLCFSFRHLLGKEVVYQPLSTVVHFEGVSSGKRAKKGNIKSYQDINRIKFVEKWTSVLTESFAKCNVDIAAKKYLSTKKIMIVDSYLPIYDRESGSNRLFNLLKIFKNLGYHLIFIPHDSKIIEPYYSMLTSKMGIEVITKERGKFSFIQVLKTISKETNILWICRPNLNKKYNFLTRYNAKTKWIYDTIDLHYIRLLREFKLFPKKKLGRKINRIKRLEISLAKRADYTIAITTIEAETLASEGVKNIEIIPNIHVPYQGKKLPSFSNRENVCFIGGYNHKPNVDAALWLINEIMPLVWKINPRIKLYLLGNKPSPALLAYANENIIIPGFIEDVSEYFLTCKIFVAPLRYGAGMKGKIGQSLEYALPIITTDIGAEGMALTHNENILIANNAEDFANNILNLYENEFLWDKISKNSKQELSNYEPQKIEQLLAKIFN